MSTTTNLKLFKHDNPTTNTNQFDVEKALNENWDKLDKNAGEIASKIQTLENTTSEKDTSQDTEIEVLKAENALLKSQIPSATVVGETVHLEDSSNMQCQISPIGASKQETREGYNVVNSYASLTDTTQYNTIYYKNNKMEVSKTYTISFKGKAGDMYRIPSSEYGVAVENKIITIDNDGIGKATFTTKSEFTVNSAGILQNYSANNTLPLTDICIVEGTEAKPFEEYGASPSIEHEAPIESVGDNINYIDLSNLTEQTIVGVKVTQNKDGSFTLNGTSNNSYGFNVAVKNGKILKANTPYSLKVTTTGSASSTSNSQIAIREDENTNLVNVSFSGNSKIYTPTKDETINYLRIYLDTGVTFTNFTVYPKLEKGTIATPYSPYGQGSIEIYSYTQNLFDKTKTSKAIGSASGYVSTEYIPAVTGDTIAKSNTTSLFLYDKTKTQITNVGNWTNKKIEVENVAYVRCNVLETEVDTFMLVKNQDLPSEYIQGQSQTKAIYTQQPFRAIGDVKDRFVKVDGVWYEEHDVSEIKLIGSDFSSYASVTEGNLFRTKSFSGYESNIALYSNYFKGVEKASLRTNNTFYYNSSTQTFDFITDEYTSLSDFQAWVNNVELKVYPILATPTLIPCTAEQVEVLESFNTYKNVTNISSDSIGELEVTYSKDLETLYNNLSQAVLGGN